MKAGKKKLSQEEAKQRQQRRVNDSCAEPGRRRAKEGQDNARVRVMLLQPVSRRERWRGTSHTVIKGGE